MDLNFKCLRYNLTSNFYIEIIYKVFTALKKKQQKKHKNEAWNKWRSGIIHSLKCNSG